MGKQTSKKKHKSSKLSKSDKKRKAKKNLKNKELGKFMKDVTGAKSPKDIRKMEKRLAKFEKEEHKKNSLSMGELKQTMPERYLGSVTPTMLVEVNKLIKLSGNGEMFKENILENMDVLDEGRYKTGSYFNAAIYCGYKKMGLTNEKAWKRTFPEKHKRHKKLGRKQNFVAAVVNSYNKGTLVQKILTLSIFPAHVLYSDTFHKSVLKSQKLMNCGNPFVEQKAASDLMRTLMPPEKAKEDEIALVTSSMDLAKELFKSSAQLVKAQHEAISKGNKSTKDILAAKVVSTEYSERGEE